MMLIKIKLIKDICSNRTSKNGKKTSLTVKSGTILCAEKVNYGMCGFAFFTLGDHYFCPMLNVDCIEITEDIEDSILPKPTIPDATMPKVKLKVGDVVRLKSGSPNMTVTFIGKDYVNLSTFNTGTSNERYCVHLLPKDALELVNNE